MILCGCDRPERERNEIKSLMGLPRGASKRRYFSGDQSGLVLVVDVAMVRGGQGASRVVFANAVIRAMAAILLRVGGLIPR